MEKPIDNTPIGIGMIGAGIIGQVAHLANFSALDSCRVVGVADLRPELGRRVAKKFSIPNVFTDHRTLLNDDNIDGVIVVTRRMETGPIVLDALNAGKHVLSEKPMAHSVEQAEKLVRAASANDLCYAVGFMKRHDPGVRKAKQIFDKLLSTSDLGRIVFLRAFCFQGNAELPTNGFVMTDEPRPEGPDLWPRGPSWMPKTLLDDYAQFLNVNIHILNLVRHFTGQTPRVRGVNFNRPQGRAVLVDFDNFSGVLEFGKSSSAKWHEGVEIFFENGNFKVELPAPLSKDKIAKFRVEPSNALNGQANQVNETEWSFLCQAKSFVDDIRQHRLPLSSGQDSIHDLTFAENIWKTHLASMAKC